MAAGGSAGRRNMARKGRADVTGRWWSDDDQLLAALGEAVRSARGVPRHFMESGKAVYGSTDLDVELAAFVHETAVDRVGPVLATRAEPSALRTLRFVSAVLSIHIEMTSETLQGQIAPAQAGEIELDPGEGAVRTIPVDEVGWFVVQPVPTGSFRLRCRTSAGAAVVTDWVTL
jgi:hypothetical protein